MYQKLTPYDRLTQVPLGIYHVILTIDAAHAPN